MHVLTCLTACLILLPDIVLEKYKRDNISNRTLDIPLLVQYKSNVGVSFLAYLTSPGTATMATDPIVMICTSTISGCQGSGHVIWKQTISRWRLYRKRSKDYFVITCSYLSSAKENGFGVLAVLNFFGWFAQKGVPNTIPEWISFNCPCTCRYQMQNHNTIVSSAYGNNMSKIKTW